MSTAPKLNPPFRADHIGSLKRPAKLLQKRKELDDGKTTQEELSHFLRPATGRKAVPRPLAGDRAYVIALD